MAENTRPVLFHSGQSEDYLDIGAAGVRMREYR
jgi:hypothetical protein